MDVNQIDLDSLTELELVELSARIDTRLRRYQDEHLGFERSGRGYIGQFRGGKGFRSRVRSLA